MDRPMVLAPIQWTKGLQAITRHGHFWRHHCERVCWISFSQVNLTRWWWAGNQSHYGNGRVDALVPSQARGSLAAQTHIRTVDVLLKHTHTHTRSFCRGGECIPLAGAVGTRTKTLCSVSNGLGPAALRWSNQCNWLSHWQACVLSLYVCNCVCTLLVWTPCRDCLLPFFFTCWCHCICYQCLYSEGSGLVIQPRQPQLL